MYVEFRWHKGSAWRPSTKNPVVVNVIVKNTSSTEQILQWDAALMEGHTLRAGAVAGLRRVRNPIRLARAVMEQSPHVMLIGKGAEAFARAQGIEMVDPAWFRTEHRWQQLQQARAREQAALAPSRASLYGTVGAVALDVHGHLAAATSSDSH